MPKSADETAEPGDNLSDDSDVIELTEEIPAGNSSPDPSSTERTSSEKGSSEKGSSKQADGSGEDQPAQDDFDALTRDIPEFRVPDQSESSGSSDASGEQADDSEEIVELRDTVDSDVDLAQVADEAVPSAAILSGRRSSRREADPRTVEESDDDFEDFDDDLSATMIIEAQQRPSDDDASDSVEPDTVEPDTVEQASDDADFGATAYPDASNDPQPSDAHPDYDRQEMVKTIQMNAIDRRAFERHVQADQIGDSVLLFDHSHAPDVVVFPPRVLTTRWKEGGPLLRAGEVEPPTGEIPVEVEARAVEPAAEDEAKPQNEQIREYDDADDTDDADEHAYDASASAKTLEEEDFPEIEPEAVEIELDSEAIEDAGEVKPPPKPTPQASSAGKPPKGRSESDDKSKPSKDKDPELSGLVQELLDENKAEPKKKAQKPRSPRETWFQKVFTEEYLRTLPKDIHRQTKREVSFIEESFELDDKDRVLDLACGFGRHSIELTKRGHEVAGLDLSMPLLQKALGEAQKQSLSIKFIHGDMRELSFEGIFSACFLWQTSFGFFDDQTNFRVLRGIHRALKPGGRLLIDVLNRDHIVTEMPHRLWWEGVECVFLEEVELDHRSSVLHTKRSFIYEDGSPPLEQNTFIRVYSLHEVCQLLRAAGFVVREVSGELHHRGRFLGAASSRIIIQAQKRPPRGGRK